VRKKPGSGRPGAGRSVGASVGGGGGSSSSSTLPAAQLGSYGALAHLQEPKLQATKPTLAHPSLMTAVVTLDRQLASNEAGSSAA